MSQTSDAILATATELIPFFIGMIKNRHPDVPIDQIKQAVTLAAQNIRLDVLEWQAAHPTTPRPTP